MNHYLLMQSKIKQIMNLRGFFRTMPQIAGAIDAVREMSEMDGYVPAVCSLVVSELVSS